MSRPIDHQRVDWLMGVAHATGLVLLCASGVQAFMWAYMVSVYSGAPPEIRKRRLPYLAVSLTILVLCLASAILFCIQTYQILLDTPPNMTTMEQWFAVQLKHQDTLDRPAGLFADLAIRVGEALLMYRCYLVWHDRRWVIIVPLLMLLAGFGINLRTYIPHGFIDSNLNAAEVLLVVCLNGILTGLISFRLIQARRRFKASLPEMDHSIYIGIVGVLVESAAPIVVFGVGFAIARICNATLKKRDIHLARSLGIFNLLFITSAILAPQLIIFRVAIGASWDSKPSTNMSHSIHFGRTTPHTTCEDEEKSSHT